VIATTIAPKMAICSQPLPIIETSCRPSRHTAEAPFTRSLTRAKPPARSSERSHHPTRDPKPLGKIFGDLIERVRFARTLRWREMDSNHRSPVKDQLVETVLFDFPAEARKRTIGGRRSQPRDLGGDLRRDHNLRDDNDRLGWGRRQAQNGGSPDGGPMVRIHLPPGASLMPSQRSTGSRGNSAKPFIEPRRRNAEIGKFTERRAKRSASIRLIAGSLGMTLNQYKVN
jgi:hypothetical protein